MNLKPLSSFVIEKNIYKKQLFFLTALKRFQFWIRMSIIYSEYCLLFILSWFPFLESLEVVVSLECWGISRESLDSPRGMRARGTEMSQTAAFDELPSAISGV